MFIGERHDAISNYNCIILNEINVLITSLDTIKYMYVFFYLDDAVQRCFLTQ